MPTAHETLVTVMTAPGAVHARAYVANDQLRLAMLGQTFALLPGATVTRGGLAGAVYSTDRCDDVLVVADDGTVYRTSQLFTTGAAPLCALTDPGAQAVIGKHLASMLSSRMLQ